MAAKPIPERYHSLTPYLMAREADRLIGFLKDAFGAQEFHRTTSPDGEIRHAELRIGDSMLMLSGANARWPEMPCAVYLYVEDTDATYRRALEAGGTSLMEPADQFYGDRSAGVKDPCGNVWWIATHVEDVSAEEIARRAEAHAGPSND